MAHWPKFFFSRPSGLGRMSWWKDQYVFFQRRTDDKSELTCSKMPRGRARVTQALGESCFDVYTLNSPWQSSKKLNIPQLPQHDSPQEQQTKEGLVRIVRKNSSVKAVYLHACSRAAFRRVKQRCGNLPSIITHYNQSEKEFIRFSINFIESLAFCTFIK